VRRPSSAATILLRRVARIMRRLRYSPFGFSLEYSFRNRERGYFAMANENDVGGGPASQYDCTLRCYSSQGLGRNSKPPETRHPNSFMCGFVAKNGDPGSPPHKDCAIHTQHCGRCYDSIEPLAADLL